MRPESATGTATAPVRKLALLLVAATAAACGNDDTSDLQVWTPADHSHPDDESDGRATPGREMSEEESVALLWVEACATCHGRSGRGDGPAAPADTEMQDLTDGAWQEATSDEAIAAVIVNGRELMPAYGPAAPQERRLNQLGIRALVRHIRQLGRGQPEESAPNGPGSDVSPGSANDADESDTDPLPTPTAESAG